MLKVGDNKMRKYEVTRLNDGFTKTVSAMFPYSAFRKSELEDHISEDTSIRVKCLETGSVFDFAVNDDE